MVALGAIFKKKSEFSMVDILVAVFNNTAEAVPSIITDKAKIKDAFLELQKSYSILDGVILNMEESFKEMEAHRLIKTISTVIPRYFLCETAIEVFYGKYVERKFSPKQREELSKMSLDFVRLII